MAEARSPSVVDALVTLTVAALADELGRKPALPLNDAPTESEPSGSVVRSMLVDVTPSVVDSVEEPRFVPLTVKVTLPSGIAVPDVGATVAVSVTLCPDVDADGDGVTLVVVGTGETFSAIVPAEPVKPASPL